MTTRHDDILRLAADGVATREIATIVGMSYQAVYEFLRVRRAADAAEPLRGEIVRRWISGRERCSDIARTTGLTIRTVRILLSRALEAGEYDGAAALAAHVIADRTAGDSFDVICRRWGLSIARVRAIVQTAGGDGPRERVHKLQGEIERLVAEGWTNKAAARHLGVDAKSVARVRAGHVLREPVEFLAAETAPSPLVGCYAAYQAVDRPRRDSVVPGRIASDGARERWVIPETLRRDNLRVVRRVLDKVASIADRDRIASLEELERLWDKAETTYAAFDVVEPLAGDADPWRGGRYPLRPAVEFSGCGSPAAMG